MYVFITYYRAQVTVAMWHRDAVEWHVNEKFAHVISVDGGIAVPLQAARVHHILCIISARRA